MKHNSLLYFALATSALLFGAEHALAIKIDIPKQYQSQLDTLKAEENAKLAEKLAGVDEESATDVDSAPMEFTGTEGDAPAEQPGEIPAESAETSHFLLESVDEATTTAEAFTDELPANHGLVSGQVVDKETSAPVAGVAIILEGTEIGTITDDQGRYSVGPAPAGKYTLSFIKTGYIEANVTDFEVKPDEVSVFPFALPPRPAEMSDEVYELQDFTVTAEEANQMMMNIDLRMSSDKMLDLFSSEDFSKYAASDVADALKRVAGVNVVEGQFAIIRGLEDRYSSTTYNGAPVPSPDPNSQSVQLDLFPSDIVSNLAVAKTFSGEMPGNSSGGSIDIVTHDYPEDLEIKVSAGIGFNSNAADKFLKYNEGSPIGSETSGSDVIKSDYGVSIRGKKQFMDREVRFKALVSHDTDYKTKEGFYEHREPSLPVLKNFPKPPHVIESGDLSLGQLNRSDGHFDLTESTRNEQTTGYLGFGVDLDKAGNQKIDGSIFYTQKEEDTVRLLSNGYIPDRLGYSFFDGVQADGSFNDANPGLNRIRSLGSWIGRSRQYLVADTLARDGQLWFAPTYESTSYHRERDLLIGQVNGEHSFDAVEGLKFTWAANKAKTTESEEAIGIKYFYEPDELPDPLPTDRILTVDELGDGQFVATSDLVYSSNSIEENQDFVRADLQYTGTLTDSLDFDLGSGVYYEKAQRTVDSAFLESPSVGSPASGEFVITGGTEQALGQAVLDELNKDGSGEFAGLRNSTNDSLREIKAVHFNSKLTLNKNIDLLGSFRVEDLLIQSNNDPFYDSGLPGKGSMFPNRFVLERILQLPVGTFGDPFTEGSPFPIADLPFYQSLVNGQIDETKFLPSLGATYRPMEGMSVRVAWSQTVARPSFREMGYYVSVEPGSSDLQQGNPQLGLSDVESWDARVEYTWGKSGDLVAFSVFRKYIDDAIEAVLIPDPANFDTPVLYQSYINNSNQAKLNGIEFEFRKNLGFLDSDLLGYFSVGGNFTYIDASVDRSAQELANTDAFFREDDTTFTEISRSRRLFGQPEWITNLDLTFDQPDWGTRVTLAYFAISDVLDAAGTVHLDQTGNPNSMGLDRYIGSYGQLDLILSQKWRNWTFKCTVKNLTDSTRSVINDPNQTASEIAETSYKVGRDYGISASYAF